MRNKFHLDLFLVHHQIPRNIIAYVDKLPRSFIGDILGGNKLIFHQDIKGF